MSFPQYSASAADLGFASDLEKQGPTALSINNSKYHSTQSSVAEDNTNEFSDSLERPLTHTDVSATETSPPPDGGLLAWTQVAVAHLVVINTWGTINSFGIFQTYYVSSLSRPPSDISWIGSIQVFLLFFIGTLTGRLTDAGYFKHIFATGSFLVVFGSFMTSLSNTYLQIFLAQGICIGLGMGCLFCPVVAVLSTYFMKKRNVAIGLAISGSATGGVVFPAMVRQLLPQIGFGWTMRSIAFLQLAILIVANMFAKTRVPPRRTGPIVEWEAFKEIPYTLFAIGSFFVSSFDMISPLSANLKPRISGAFTLHSTSMYMFLYAHTSFHFNNYLSIKCLCAYNL
jgi:MFS family permease